MPDTSGHFPLSGFTCVTRDWFKSAFAGPTEVQTSGWATIAKGSHSLLVAPTGSGKTLAAFLWAIDALVRLPETAAPGVRVLYISPLKALVYDVERNLRGPLAGVTRVAEGRGRAFRKVQVDVRTGDTPQEERRRQLREPADILVTTPESLYLLLGSQARETLRSVETVIVDEVHALAPTKRGAHLVLSLERLSEIAQREPQRVGLSATLRPLEGAARFLGGGRPVEIVNAGTDPLLDLEVVVPVPDMERPVRDLKEPEPASGPLLADYYRRDGEHQSQERGLWAAIYPRLLKEIRGARSTIIFVNSRGLCERLSQRLNAEANETLVLAHHGSLSHAKRAEIEDRLKRGELRAIVATSSLELGVDMGAVDRVILVESPGSVARGLQRVGRAGHQVGAISRGRIYPKFRNDLLECAVVAQRMQEGAIEALEVPRNPLDVLAQQLVAMCCDRPRSPQELLETVRRAWPYRQLSREVLERTLDMLSGHYPSSELADLRPLLSWDRQRDLLSPRRGTPMLTRLNAGTIPDRGNYGVHLGPDGPRVGELDEEMVFETRVGEIIALGASTWRVEEIGRDRVLVSPAPGEPGKLPFWHGDSPGRPLELGRELGAFVRRVGALSRTSAEAWVREHTPLDPLAARNLVEYLQEQKTHTGTLPDDRNITLERFRDELGDWRICILSPFGARVHAPWAMALQHTLEHKCGFQIQVMYTDDGIALRLADVEQPVPVGDLLPDPDEVGELVTTQLADSALFAGLFRENAVRSLLLPRRAGRERRPLWVQRLKSQQLLGAVRGFPDFPIVMETYRQCLSDVFDLFALEQLLRDIQSRRVRVIEVETTHASPFARSLVFAYVAAYIYEQDAPLAERKAQALTLDRRLLAELLGQTELRTLIDSDVLAELEEELQRLTRERYARDHDELHDLLRRLGDLSPVELGQRCTEDPQPWLKTLRDQQRAAELRVAGEQRWIATEDAGLYRDALGAVPPGGLPESFLESVPDPLQRLFRRYAQTHGPFLSEQVARRFALLPSQVEPVLKLLHGESRLVQGEIRPAGNVPEWCDPEVLRHLKRRTLARLRHQAAPLEAETLGRFLPLWQGLGRKQGGTDELLEAVRGLTGLPLPWSDLSVSMLPARVSDFQPGSLDLLCATGAVVWVGKGALGSRDGRVALYPRESAALLIETDPEYRAGGPVQQGILDHLGDKGACFMLELEQVVRKAHPETSATELEQALWDLVWDGQVTNDTAAPLRMRQGSGRRRRGGRAGSSGGRWSLVGHLASGASETERLLARAWMLLERYGVVSREAAVAEDLQGGFGALYPVFRELESTGKLRRGYFVEGLSGAQFALPGAVERLRAARGEVDGTGPKSGEMQWLSAADPANPYGALLPWPEVASDRVRPKRVAGARLLLAGGHPLMYLNAGGRHLLTFPGLGAEPESLVDTLSQLQRLPKVPRQGVLRIEKIDGVPAQDSALKSQLLEVGFISDYRGIVLERRFQGSTS